MLRKVIIFLTILLIAFLGYFSYKLLKKQEIAVNSLIDAVPFDASLIIEVNRPQLLFDILYSPPIEAESFFNIPFIRDPLAKLKMLDSVASQDKDVKSAIRRAHSTIISGHQTGKDELDLIYYLKLNDEKEFNAISKIIKANIKAKGNISQHNYEDARINDVIIFNRKSGGFSYAYYRGMLILSKSSILVEEVIRQAKTNTSIRTKAGLETVIKTAGRSSPFNVYINFDYFPTLALNFIHSRFKPELDAIAKFAHWIELDCNVENNAIILNGFSSAENTNGFLSDIFQNQQPLDLTLPALLPSNTESFFALGISDYAKFQVNFSDYQKKNLANPDFDKKLINYKRSTGINLDTEFIKAFDNEICFCYYPGNDMLENNIFTVIKAKGNQEAKEFITLLSSTNKDAVDSSGTASVYDLSKNNIPQLLFGNIFGLNKNKYCSISENYIIFNDSAAQLNNFTRDFSERKNLSVNANYRNMVDLLSEDTYCYFYISPQAEQLYRYYLKYTSEQMRTQYRYGLSQVQAIVYQFGRNNDLFYNNAFIQFSPKTKGNVNKLWEVQLDNRLSSKIQLVKNHTTKETEIICQDKANNLYLISRNGEIIWKRKLDNRIISDIYQADLFANKKLQYVFNTSEKVIVLDRNGKDVEGFPIKLSQKASAGMAVFDYDNTRNYRFLVPLSDNRLHCLDRTGKEVAGWEKPVIGNRPAKIRHYSINKKDFIIIWDEHTIHFFDRKGEERIQPRKNIRVATNSDVFLNSTKNVFECTDSAGSINLIALNGDVTKMQTGIYPASHYYLTSDIDFNNIDDHLFFFGRKFEAYTTTGARIVNYPLSGEVNLLPKITVFNASSYLFTYTDTTTKKIFLNNQQGNNLIDTPLTGNSEVTFEALRNSDNLINLYYCNDNILTSVSVK
ncbi:MAG TPA: DUF3352 domain-containing protein [Bacteroidales bacterium]|nr:DUF3352 domain-containing protein [Bacteroidales bacterium]